LGAYFINFVDAFVDSIFLEQVFSFKGGPITRRTPREWIWEGIDELLVKLGQTPNVGFLFSDLEHLSPAEALAAPEKQRKAWTGGSKKELTKFYEADTDDRGNAVIEGWVPPQKVRGNDEGSFFAPGIDPQATLDIWVEALLRSVPAEKRDRLSVKDIETYQFFIREDIFDTSIDNPANAPYTQDVGGFLNMTSASPFRIFFSKPHFFGVEDSAIVNAVEGLNPENPLYKDWWSRLNLHQGFPLLGLPQCKCPSVLFVWPNSSTSLNHSLLLSFGTTTSR